MKKKNSEFVTIPFPGKSGMRLKTKAILLLIAVCFLVASIAEGDFAGVFVVIALEACCGVFIFLRWRKKRISSSRVGVLLYNFIIENKLFDVDKTRGNDGKENERVTNYIRFSYCETSDVIFVNVAKRGDRFIKIASDLDAQLSAMLGLELYEKTDTVTSCCYAFKRQKDARLQMSSDTVDCNELHYNNTTLLPLNSSLMWNILKQPHALIAGVTGSGKTTFIFYILVELLRMRADLFICDPKGSDLASLKFILGDKAVASSSNNIARVTREVCALMQERYMTYKENPDKFKFGASYVDYGLNPVVLLFDEMGAFRAGAEKTVYAETMSHLTELILKGRELGVFVIISTQQPNANNIPTEIRDQLGLRIAMGNMGSEATRMVFGSISDTLQTINTVGGAYIYLDGLGWETPKSFEAPYVDYGEVDFMNIIRSYQNERLETNLP